MIIRLLETHNGLIKETEYLNHYFVILNRFHYCY